jgi:hypothetical protein
MISEISISVFVKNNLNKKKKKKTANDEGRKGSAAPSIEQGRSSKQRDGPQETDGEGPKLSEGGSDEDHLQLVPEDVLPSAEQKITLTPREEFEEAPKQSPTTVKEHCAETAAASKVPQCSSTAETPKVGTPLPRAHESEDKADGRTAAKKDENEEAAVGKTEKSQQPLEITTMPAGAPQTVQGAASAGVAAEIRLSPRTARHLLKFLPPVEKEAFLLSHPVADIPGSPQHLVNLSNLDYLNYSANTKSVDVEQRLMEGDEVQRHVKVDMERDVKVEEEHRRFMETEAFEEEDDMSKGPFRVNEDEARRLGFKDKTFLRNYEVGCQRILDGIKRNQRARLERSAAENDKMKYTEDQGRDEHKGKMPEKRTAENNAQDAPRTGKTVPRACESSGPQLPVRSTRPPKPPQKAPAMYRAEDVATIADPM